MLGNEIPHVRNSYGEGSSSGNPEDREKQTVRKRKPSYFIVKLICGWVSLILVIIVGSHYLQPKEAESPEPVASKATVVPEVKEADYLLLYEGGLSCHQAFSSYLAARTPEERSQFVIKPVTTVARMNRFYSENPSINFDPKTFKSTHSSVVHLPTGPAIEIHWRSTDGYELDSLFMKENDEWRLDWDHFARFSDYPWALFLAGSGENFSEFRLLARERLAEERKNAENVSIVLYAPRFGYAKELGLQSPEFLVRRDTENGKLLDAAFKMVREGKRVFGGKSPNNDPEGFIRVRVKVRRFEEDGERRFEVTDVIACHWYSVDEPGVEVAEPSAPK